MPQATQGLHRCYGADTESNLITLDYDCRLLVLWPFPWWGHEKVVTMNLIMSNRTTSPVAIKKKKKSKQLNSFHGCACLPEGTWFLWKFSVENNNENVLANTTFSSSISAIHLFIVVHTDTPVHRCDSWRHQKFSWQLLSRLLCGQQLSRQSHRPGNTNGQMAQ